MAPRAPRDPARLCRFLLRVPARDTRRARPPRRRLLQSALERPRRRSDARARLVYPLAGDGLDGAHGSGRPPLRTCPRPLCLSRQGHRARFGHRPLRAPHGRRRHRVPRRPADRPRPLDLGHPARTRLLQRRRRDTNRRLLLGSRRPPNRRFGRNARRRAGPPVRARHAADDRPCGTCRRLDRLPLLLDVVRRHPDPRWQRLLHARNRDLHPGRTAVRPPRGDGARADPTRRRHHAVAGIRPVGGAPRCRSHWDATGTAATPRTPAMASGRCPPRAARAARCRSAGGTRGAIARDSFGLRARASIVHSGTRAAPSSSRRWKRLRTP